MGGGSATLRRTTGSARSTRCAPRSATTADRRYERGCDIDQTTPPLGASSGPRARRQPRTRGRVLRAVRLRGDRSRPAHVADGRHHARRRPRPRSRSALDVPTRHRHASRPTRAASTPSRSCRPAASRVPSLDGELVLDGVTDPPPPGTSSSAWAASELAATVEPRVPAERVDVMVEFADRRRSVLPRREGRMPAAERRRSPRPGRGRRRRRRRGRRRRRHQRRLGDARVTTGTMDLPGDQDELVTRVVGRQPQHRGGGEHRVTGHDGVGRRRARDRCRSWFGGQEMADALADVAHRRGRARRRLADHVPDAPRAQPVVRELPRRERRGALRRGRARGLPLV